MASLEREIDVPKMKPTMTKKASQLQPGQNVFFEEFKTNTKRTNTKKAMSPTMLKSSNSQAVYKLGNSAGGNARQARYLGSPNMASNSMKSISTKGGGGQINSTHSSAFPSNVPSTTKKAAPISS